MQRRWQGAAVLSALLLLLVVVGLGLSAWLVAEEAGVAPPMAETVEVLVEGATTPKPTPAPVWSRVLRSDWQHGDLCPATLFVRTEAGEPVEGDVRLHGDKTWVGLGPEGDADWPHRPCGVRGKVRLRDRDDPGAGTHHRIPFEDADEVTLVVGEPGETWVRPVDEEGLDLEAVVSPGVVQDDGWVHIVGRGTTLEVFSRVEGERGGSAQVPLDGGQHLLEVPRDRVVDVDIRCDQCTGDVFCLGDFFQPGLPCAGSVEEGALLCGCPPTGGARLELRMPDVLNDREVTHLLAYLPEDQEQVFVDLRGEMGSVSAWLDPDLSATVALVRPGFPESARDSFEPEGNVLFADGLLPGRWRLDVFVWDEGEDERRDWTNHVETHSFPFVLRSGEALDAGLLEVPRFGQRSDSTAGQP